MEPVAKIYSVRAKNAKLIPTVYTGLDSTAPSLKKKAARAVEIKKAALTSE